MKPIDDYKMLAARRELTAANNSRISLYNFEAKKISAHEQFSLQKKESILHTFQCQLSVFAYKFSRQKFLVPFDLGIYALVAQPLRCHG